MTRTGLNSSEYLRGGPWLADLMDAPSPYSLTVRGPKPWRDPTHPLYGARTGTGKSTAIRSQNLAALQAAIDDAQSDGGAVLLPNATIEVNGNVNIASTELLPLYIVGLGRRRSVVKFIGNFGFRLATNAVGCHFRSFSIDSDQSKFSATAAIASTRNSLYLEFFDLAFEEGFAIGIRMVASYQVDVDLCSFYSGKGMVMTTPAGQETSPQYTISRCQFNASNGIMGIDWDTGGESLISRSYFGNMMSDGSATTKAVAAIRLVGCGNTHIDACTFESNNLTTSVTNQPADIIVDNSATVKITNPKMVTSGIEDTHDFIRVQNGGKVIVDGADINGAFLPGRRNYFVNWTDAGAGWVHIQSPVNQTQGASYGKIPLVVGTPTSISYEPVFPAKTSDTTVGGTVTETEVYSCTIAANELFAGRILETRIQGYFSTALAAHQATIRLKVNGTTVSTATTPTAAAYTNEPVDLRSTLTVRTFAVEQEEKVTVVGTVTTGGNARIIVTAAGMGGSPVTVTFAVALNDTAVQVAAAARTALALDANVGAFFDVGGYTSSADVFIKAKAAAANDATMNMDLANDTCAGLTAVPTSTNTVAGVAGAVMGYAECFAANVARSAVNTATTAVDVSAGGTISVTVEWSNADAGTTMTITQGVTRD